jgi:hypothetical protein
MDLTDDRNQDGPYRTTILEPLGKMCAYFPVVNEHITKRNKKACQLIAVMLGSNFIKRHQHHPDVGL